MSRTNVLSKVLQDSVQTRQGRQNLWRSCTDCAYGAEKQKRKNEKEKKEKNEETRLAPLERESEVENARRVT